MAWTDLSAAVSGAPPAPRYGHGFAAAGGLLYSFGGMGQDGEAGRGGGGSGAGGEERTGMVKPPEMRWGGRELARRDWA